MKSGRNILQTLIKFRTVVILIALAIVFFSLNHVFINPANILNMIKRMSYTAICAFGMTFLLTLGVFDLSAGSEAAMISVILAYFIRSGTNPVLMMILALLMATGCGLLNGFISVKGHIAAFLTTLATMNIFRGLAQVVANGRTIPVKVKWLTDGFANGTVFGVIPTPMILMIVLFIISLWMFYKTKFGYYCKCIGGNQEAARVAGVKVAMVSMGAFTFMGFMSGMSSMVLTGLMNAGMPDIGESLAMDAITAAVLGGTALSGGVGSMWGSLAGALIMAELSTGLALMGAQTQVQNLVKGIVIILAILMDNAFKARRVVEKN